MSPDRYSDRRPDQTRIPDDVIKKAVNRKAAGQGGRTIEITGREKDGPVNIEEILAQISQAKEEIADRTRQIHRKRR